MPAHPWLQSYPPSFPWDADIPERPLTDLLDNAARRYADNIAIDFLGHTIRYRELANAVNRLAAGLQKAGIGPSVHVGIFMPNCPQFIIAYYAILKAGGTVVNYNPLYSVSEIMHQINDSATQVIITLSLAALYPKVAACLGMSKLRTIIVGDFQEQLPLAKRLAFTMTRRKEMVEVPADAHHLRLETLLASSFDMKPVTIHPDNHLAVLQYTGGTTGVPKGAMLTHANLYANTLQCGLWFTGLRHGEEMIFGVLPLFHVFAMTVAMNLSIHTGSTLLLHPKFDMKGLLYDIHFKRPTLLPGVPTMFAALNHYKHTDQYDLTSLKMAISGGGPLPQEVKTHFEKRSGCKLIEGYGLSESSPVVSANPLFGVNKSGSIGLPFPATEIKIAHMSDPKITLPVKEVGEICVRGPQVMRGYFNNYEESSHILRDGFLHTGDLGYMDEEGYVFVVDRLKEMIISGGYKIYPRTLEEILYAHPDIVEAAVIGVRHPERVQVVKAFIVKKEGATLSEAEVKNHLRDKISAYAMPHAIEFRDALPKSAIGKILKKLLVEEEAKKH